MHFHISRKASPFSFIATADLIMWMYCYLPCWCHLHLGCSFFSACLVLEMKCAISQCVYICICIYIYICVCVCVCVCVWYIPEVMAGSRDKCICGIRQLSPICPPEGLQKFMLIPVVSEGWVVIYYLYTPDQHPPANFKGGRRRNVSKGELFIRHLLYGRHTPQTHVPASL